MSEEIILGLVQGVAEWLPVSSEGLIVLIKSNFFSGQTPLMSIVKFALYLHLGTFLAALLYFWEDVGTLLKTIFQYENSSEQTQKTFQFLLISTIISGLLGILLIVLLKNFVEQFDGVTKIITLIIGVLLLGTGFIQLKAPDSGHRTPEDLKLNDSIVLGIIQGCAVKPGFSRSGLTVAALLLKDFDKTYALKLSFLMSLPIVLAGNIILNINAFQWSLNAFLGLLAAFFAGYITIHALLRWAQDINFGYFVFLFGLLTIASVYI